MAGVFNDLATQPDGNEWINDTPVQKTDRLLGVRKRKQLYI